MDYPSSHNTRSGVLTRSQISKGENGGVIDVETNDVENVSHVLPTDGHENVSQTDDGVAVAPNMVSGPSSGTSSESCQSGSIDNTRVTDETVHVITQELISTKTELYNTMKDLIETRDDCSLREEHIENLKLQVMRLQNELSESKRQNSKLQGELSLARAEIDNLKLEACRRQSNDEQPIENLQVNSHAHGYTSSQSHDEYTVQNAHSARSFDYNHGYMNSGSTMLHGLANPRANVGSFVHSYTDMVPQRSLSGSSGASNSDEPKFRLPYFNGKGDFQSFWTIFQIGVKKFNWNGDKQIEQLLCSLKDDALTSCTSSGQYKCIKSEVRRLFIA